MSAMGSKYLYGVMPKDREGPLGLIGLRGAQVHAVAHEGIAAAVSETEPLRVDSMPRTELLSLITAHQSVLEKILEARVVVPVKFGTTLQDDGEVRAVLEKGHPRFLHALSQAGGKVEMGVVALWADLKAELQKIAHEENLKPSVESLGGSDSDEIEQSKIELGRRLQSALRRRSEEAGAEFMRLLTQEAENSKSRAAMDDSMILNAAFWLKRSDMLAFAARTAELEVDYRERVVFKLAGPLPPYSFITAEVRRIDALVLKEARTLLQLAEEADRSEIQARYRELAQKHHPDRRRGDCGASRRFEHITAAYRALLEYARRGGPLDVVVWNGGS